VFDLPTGRQLRELFLPRPKANPRFSQAKRVALCGRIFRNLCWNSVDTLMDLETCNQAFLDRILSRTYHFSNSQSGWSFATGNGLLRLLLLW
jgi:hypothetical protein